MPRLRGRSAANIPVTTILVVGVILLWGLAHRLYSTLLPELGIAFAMTPGQVTSARTAVILGYFLLTFPAAFISRNFGYKLTILLGLGIFAVGMFLFYLAAIERSFAFLILTATVMGSGLAIVSVAAGPFILFAGPSTTAVQRVNIAEAFSALGGAAGLILTQSILTAATHSGSSITQQLVLPISLVGATAIIMAFLIENTRFPSIPFDRVASDDSTWASILPLLRFARFGYAIAAMMLVLFTELIIGAFAVPFATQTLPHWPAQQGYIILLWGFFAVAAGRLAVPLALMVLTPMRMNLVFCIGGILCSLLANFAQGALAIGGVLGACFFVAVVGPTVFTLILQELGAQKAKSASAIITFLTFTGTGILFMGTRFIPPAQIHHVMLIPALCMAIVALLLLHLLRSQSAALSGHDQAHEPL